MLYYPTAISIGSVTSDIKHSDNDPSAKKNLPKGTIWVNDNTGVLFICTDDTKDNTVWDGYKPTIKIAPTIADVVDFFGDGSGVALLQLDGNLSDTGGQYNANDKGNPTFVDDAKFGQAIDIRGSNQTTFDITGLPDIKSISMWVKKDSKVTATNSNNYVLDTRDNYGGSSFFIISNSGSFRYSNSDLHLTKKIINGQTDPSSAPVDEWIHCYIEFESTVNGMIFGSSYPNDSGYLFGGMMDEIRLFNRALTADEVNKLYNEK